jgi:hypothetical protein
MPIPLTTVFRAILQFRTDDKVWSFTLAYNCSSGFSAIDSSEALSTGIMADIIPLVLLCVSADTTFEGIYVSHSLPETAAPDVLAGNSQVGDRTADALPPNMCLVITRQNNAGELVRQGRVYIGGLAKADVDEGHIADALMNGVVRDLRDRLCTNIDNAGQTFQPVVISSDPQGMPPVPFAAEVTNCRATAVLYSQSRRTTKQFGTAP